MSHPPPNPDDARNQLAFEFWVSHMQPTRMMGVDVGRVYNIDFPSGSDLPRHGSLQCQSCGFLIANGVRWKCTTCTPPAPRYSVANLPSFNICGDCERRGKDKQHADGKHVFIQILDSRDRWNTDP